MYRESRAVQQPLSRRLPPPEAWRQPDRWLDLSTGLMKPAKRHQPHPTDNKGLVVIPDVIAELKDLFWDDYEWEVDQNDQQLRPDNHHTYFTKTDYQPINNDDSLIPYLFREQQSNLARIPRQTHNVWHDRYDKPPKPSQKVMYEYIEEHIVIREALINLVRAAKHTTELYGTFPMRREDVARHPERINYREEDSIAEEYLRNKFNARFSYYRSALDEFRGIPQLDVIYPDLAEIDEKPKVVAAKLGAFVTRRAVNFLPHFSLKAA